MTKDIIDRMGVTCNTCGYSGTIAAVQLHSCDVQLSGGRCDDFPCCGHTDGDGCQTLPEHTSDYYLRNPMLLHEPGTPEYYDALDDMYPDTGEDDSDWDED
jgi:hypothetical protein